MNYGDYYVLFLVLGPLLGVVGTMLTQRAQAAIAKRTTAGTVETSNAAELWAENDRVYKRLEAQVDRLSTEVGRLASENTRLATENRALNEQVKLLTLEVTDLKERLKVPQNEDGGGA